MTRKKSHKILTHPDQDEIVSKLIIGVSPKDIKEWLDAKYNDVNEKKFTLSEKYIKEFQDTYLDFYTQLKEDFEKTKNATTEASFQELELSIRDNPTYKNKMMQLANQEIDIKKMLSGMINAIEARCMQVFEEIQADPRNITRNDRIMMEWFDRLGANLERYSKFILGSPDQIIQHNVNVQHVDLQSQVIQDAIRETLAEMDIESSLKFMELLTEKMNKLKVPSEKEQIVPTEHRLQEAKIITETIGQKLNL